MNSKGKLTMLKELKKAYLQKMFPQEGEKVPRVRFEGFSEEWEERKLGEIAPFQRGFDLPKSEMKTGEYPVVMSNGINGFHSEYKAKAPGVITGRSGTIGNLHYVEKDYWPHNTTLWVTDFNGNFPQFIYYLYSKVDLGRFGTGTGVPTLNRNYVHDENVFIPCVPEQTAIGNFFRKLDELITCHQCKLDSLKALKKACLQQMFPQNGENAPRLRVAGFTGGWERKKLGEVASFRRGSFPQPYGFPEWYDEENGMPFVQVVDVGNDLRLVDDTKQKISELAQPKSVYVPKGRVVVTLQGSIGRVAVTQYPSYADRTLLIFEDYNIATDEYFWAYVIQQKFDIEKQVAPGGTIKTITKEVLSDFLVSLPNLPEQTAIGSFFRTLDNLITLHS